MKTLLVLYVLPATFFSVIHFTDAGQRTQCNDGIDKLLVTINENIKSRSPINKTDKAYCDLLSLNGCYTIVRNGDIFGEHMGGPDDCYEQDFNIIIKSLNFTCDANMEMIMQEINKEATKIGGKRRKRGLEMPSMDEMDKESAIILGFWLDVCINGKLKICKNDNEKTEAQSFGLCKPQIENCQIECAGDNEGLTQLCAKGDFLEKLKNMLSSIVQVAAQHEIQNSIKNGPSGIATKFNCEYVAERR